MTQLYVSILSPYKAHMFLGQNVPMVYMVAMVATVTIATKELCNNSMI